MADRLNLNIAIDMVDLPSYKMVIFHSYVNFYQRAAMAICGCPRFPNKSTLRASSRAEASTTVKLCESFARNSGPRRSQICTN